MLGYVLKKLTPTHRSTETGAPAPTSPGLSQESIRPIGCVGPSTVSPWAQLSGALHRPGGPCPGGQGSLWDAGEEHAGIV